MPKVRAKVDVMYSIRITKELDNELCRVAEAEGRTKTNVIRHYLEVGLKMAGKTQNLVTTAVQYIDGDDVALQEILDPNS